MGQTNSLHLANNKAYNTVKWIYIWLSDPLVGSSYRPKAWCFCGGTFREKHKKI